MKIIILALALPLPIILLACNESRSQSDTRTSVVPAQTGIQIENETVASSQDVEQTRKFLADLPFPACSGTSASVMSEGTVRIHMVCNGNGKSMDGYVTIKNGIVTNIK